MAGIAALLIAKAHKLHDRVDAGKERRLRENDAGDVFRLMQASDPATVGHRLNELRRHAVAAETIDAGVRYLAALLTRRGEGTAMAVQALRLAIPEDRVIAVMSSYASEITELTVPARG